MSGRLHDREEFGVLGRRCYSSGSSWMSEVANAAASQPAPPSPWSQPKSVRARGGRDASTRSDHANKGAVGEPTVGAGGAPGLPDVLRRPCGRDNFGGNHGYLTDRCRKHHATGELGGRAQTTHCLGSGDDGLGKAKPYNSLGEYARRSRYQLVHVRERAGSALVRQLSRIWVARIRIRQHQLAVSSIDDAPEACSMRCGASPCVRFSRATGRSTDEARRTGDF